MAERETVYTSNVSMRQHGGGLTGGHEVGHDPAAPAVVERELVGLLDLLQHLHQALRLRVSGVKQLPRLLLCAAGRLCAVHLRQVL